MNTNAISPEHARPNRIRLVLEMIKFEHSIFALRLR